MEFSREVPIRLYDTDAAGFLFFGAQFRIAHEVFEEFVAELGFSVGGVIRERTLLFPVVHAEADYAAPLTVGDRVTVSVGVARIGDSSFAVRYRLALPAGREAGRVELVHVTLDAASRTPVPVPAPLRAALERYLG
jgi:1,4-dihydroxy-2-naphthoyl-CoA hydrolase